MAGADLRHAASTQQRRATLISLSIHNNYRLTQLSLRAIFFLHYLSRRLILQLLKRLGEFMNNVWDRLLLALLIAIVLALWSISENAKKDEFMRECVQDHKRYECEIMYK